MAPDSRPAPEDASTIKLNLTFSSYPRFGA